MKKLIMGFLLLGSMSSYATSYWYDFCDAAGEVRNLMDEYHSVEVPDADECSRLSSAVSPKTTQCTQVMTSYNRKKAEYNVSIKTLNHGVYLWTVTFKRKGGECARTELKLNYKIPN